MSARKAKRVAKKPATLVPEPMQRALEIAVLRLRHAQDVLSALAYCADQEAELDLGPVAICARDLIDKALDSIQAIAPSTQGGEP